MKKVTQLGFPGIAEDESFYDTRDPNPMVKLHGSGPVGSVCKTCSQLYFREAWTVRHYKCRRRKKKWGPGSDHKQDWNACAMYDSKEEIPF